MCTRGVGGAVVGGACDCSAPADCPTRRSRSSWAANVMAAPSPTAHPGVVTAAAAHDDANDAHDDANDARRGGHGLISAARAARALIRTDRSTRARARAHDDALHRRECEQAAACSRASACGGGAQAAGAGGGGDVAGLARRGRRFRVSPELELGYQGFVADGDEIDSLSSRLSHLPIFLITALRS